MPAHPEKIRVKCPSCGKEGKASPAKAEQPIRCPICGEENIFTRIEGEETGQAAVVATKKANYILPVLFIAFIGLIGLILLRDEGNTIGAAPASAYVTQISDLQKMVDSIKNIKQDALPILHRMKDPDASPVVPTIASIAGVKTVSGLVVESSWILVSVDKVSWGFLISNHTENTIFSVPVFIITNENGNIINSHSVPMCLEPREPATDIIEVELPTRMMRTARCFLVLLPFHTDMFAENGLLPFFRKSPASSHIQDVMAHECWWMPHLPENGRFRVDYFIRVENRSDLEKDEWFTASLRDNKAHEVLKDFSNRTLPPKKIVWVKGAFSTDLGEASSSIEGNSGSFCPIFHISTYEAIEKDVEKYYGKHMETYKK